VSPGLQRVIRLIFLNLGLTAALTVLVLVFNDSLIGYQVAHTALPPNTTEASLRMSLRAASWSRLLSVGIISIVYVLLTKRLRQGRRRAYLRTIAIGVLGLAGLGIVATTTPYPWWVHVEQVMQAMVLAALLWSVTRPEVRAIYAKNPSAAPAPLGQ
jgi:glucan phosphoethanolaminetransferase (alkaline phosphatase superfamily)